jgi:hypothetical protein
MRIKKAYERSHRRQAGSDPAFPARLVLTVSFVLSLVIGLVVTIASAMRKHRRQLDISVEMLGPHDFAVQDLRARLPHKTSSIASRAQRP